MKLLSLLFILGFPVLSDENDASKNGYTGRWDFEIVSLQINETIDPQRYQFTTSPFEFIEPVIDAEESSHDETELGEPFDDEPYDFPAREFPDAPIEYQTPNWY